MRGSRAGRVAALAAFAALAAPVAAQAADPLPPLDPQNWSFQDDLSWANYKPLPGPDYSDPSKQPTVKKWKVAIVLGDFQDRPFIVSQPAGSTIWGTPTAEANNIPREQVPQFYADFLNKPQALNHFQTMNRYWMEDSFGKYGVELVPFGPYKLPDRAYQYGINFYANNNFCPTPALTPCRANPSSVIRNDIRALWQADVGAAKIAEFDNIFYTFAGEDQSSTWQEFGEMKFADQNSVPDAFGPKAIDPSLPNWAPTRYVPWSSWAVATNIWPNAQGNNSIEAESSGMSTYAHELSHNLNIPDNYGNPFGTVQQRGFTGMWDMMSRGTFNGPGGQHTRYNIPPTQGAALGSQHNIRNKRFLNFVGDADLVRLNRNGLAQSGMAVADVTAREVPHSAGEVAGFQIALDGTVGDNAAPCTVATDWRCDGVRTQGTTITGKYNHYTVEVVQQVGSDSYTPGHGVILTKTKTSASNCGANVNCFAWVIDAHPDDINKVDFVLPSGQPKMATLGDERQLNDASFNAGTGSGTLAEWEDTRNRLHFYIVDKRTDSDGILHYKVGVRSLDGAGPQTRGVSLATPAPGAALAGWESCTFPLTNTGAAADTSPTLHPQDEREFLTSDVYRLSAKASGTGWTASLRNEFAAAKFGETVQVPVYFTKGTGAGQVMLTATSESDPTKTVSATCSVADGAVGGAVPATLSLTLGGPASFGAFTPGLAKDYTAQTSANVISTAGDATLSVSDPGHMTNGAFSLPSALQVGFSKSSWAGPASNDPVTISFTQHIGSTDALRTGSYSKTLTFTLSTTKP
jgi:M6 family metalloprotease-like protein